MRQWNINIFVRKAWLMIIWIFCASITHGKPRTNEIDQIRNGDDALIFINKHKNDFHLCSDTFNFSYNHYSSDPDFYETYFYCDSIVTQKWVKADFDGNGKTDLFFSGFLTSEYHSLLILSEPGKKYKVIDLHQGYCFPTAVWQNDKAFILENRVFRCNGNHHIIKKDTLAFVKGELLELNTLPSKFTPDSVVMKYLYYSDEATSWVKVNRHKQVRYSWNPSHRYGNLNIVRGKYLLSRKKLRRIMQIASYADYSDPESKYKTDDETIPVARIYIYFPESRTVVLSPTYYDVKWSFLVSKLYGRMGELIRK